jgi:hypothetical protein
MLSLLIQVIFVIHVIKTKRDNSWIWIIMVFPGIGCLVYFLLEMLPDLRHSRTGKKTVAKLVRTIDPHHDLKKRIQALEISDNIENRTQLAKECVAEGLYEQAIDLYSGSLKGFYQDDPYIMLELAIALFHHGDYAKTKATLVRLIEANPDFKSSEGHLLFARTLEALQENEAALHEYEILASYYSGYEAKCRYALLLKKLGYTEKALLLFNEIIAQSKLIPKQYRKAQKEWIEIASQQLS